MPGPVALPFDLTRQANPSAGSIYNQGCPPGYFAQFMDPTGFNAFDVTIVHATVPPIGDGTDGPWLRCRLIEGATPQVIAEESGAVAADSWNNLVSSVGGFFSGVASWTTWLVVGVAAVFLLTRRRSNPPARAHRRRRLNPPVRVGAPPPGAVGMVPGEVEEVRYRRGGADPGPFKHPYRRGVVMFPLRDGDVRLRAFPRRRLWVRQ